LNRKPIVSAYLLSVGYDSRERVLEIERRSGEVYRYSSVQSDVYDNLLKAPDHEAYCRDCIENRYICRKLK
jgi:hypothetical protein